MPLTYFRAQRAAILQRLPSPQERGRGKGAICAVLFLLASQFLSAQTLSTTDVTLLRGAVQEFPGSLLADEDDNLYLGASYSFDFLYDPDEEPLPGGSRHSGALVKRNAQRETVWAYHARYQEDLPCANLCQVKVELLALTPAGQGIYAGMEFEAAADVDNGDGAVIIENGSAIVKLDDAGNYEKAYRFTSETSPQSVDISGITTDEAGNLYVAGTYRAGMTITTGESTVSLPQPGEAVTVFNGFIGRISPEGTIDWMYSIPTGQLSNVKGGLVLRNGELSWAGRVIDGVDFDPSFVVLRTDLNSSIGNFVVRYTTDGQALDLFTYGDREEAGFVRDFKVGLDGKYYAIGTNTNDFNLTADDASSPSLTAPIWIASWERDGTLRWHQEYPSVRMPTIDVDAFGNVFISASATEAVAVPGPDGPVSIDPGFDEISFLHAVNADGFPSTPVQLFSNNQTRGFAVEVSASGRLYWTGTYRGELTDPNGQIVASDDIDIFLLTLDGAISVGTSNPEASPTLSLFPNPTTDRLNVANLAYSEGAIVDGFGRTVRQLGNETISTRGLPAGVYFLRLRTNQGWITGRFLKQ